MNQCGNNTVMMYCWAAYWMSNTPFSITMLPRVHHMQSIGVHHQLCTGLRTCSLTCSFLLLFTFHTRPRDVLRTLSQQHNNNTSQQPICCSTWLQRPPQLMQMTRMFRAAASNAKNANGVSRRSSWESMANTRYDTSAKYNVFVDESILVVGQQPCSCAFSRPPSTHGQKGNEMMMKTQHNSSKAMIWTIWTTTTFIVPALPAALLTMA